MQIAKITVQRRAHKGDNLDTSRIDKIENELKTVKDVMAARESQILQLVQAYAIPIQTESKVS